MWISSLFFLQALFVGTLCLNVNHYSYKHRVELQEKYESLTKQVQQNVINTENFTPLDIKNTWHTRVGKFKLSKPCYDNNVIHIHSCIIPQKDEACILMMKMISQESFLKKYGSIPVGKPMNAKEINKRILSDELAKRINTDLRFTCVPDIVYGTALSSGFEWFAKKIQTEYDERDKQVFIKSPSLITDVNLPVKQYAGLHYMKLITPEYADYLIDKYGTSIF